jgi:uncharacterized protein YacL (UPF0231 family)
MLQRLLAVALVALFAVSCGGEDGGKVEALKAAPAAKPEMGSEQAKQIGTMMEDAAKAAKQSVVKEEVAKPPLATEYYIDNDAFEATGFRWEALRKKVDEGQTKNQAYVKLIKYADMPETANIYDDMGNHLYIVSYLWDKDFNIWGSVYKSSNDRMLNMYLYCKGQKDLFVHDLSTFRVHAAFTRKIVTTDNSLSVEFVTGQDLRGDLPIWPECKDVAEAQEKATPYQSPWGLSRQVFAFSPDGEFLGFATYDAKGELAEDIRGIARTELAWKDGRKQQEAFFAKDGLLAKYVYSYNDKGKVTSKVVSDAAGAPALDYFGTSIYEFEYDKRGRMVKETRKDVAGKVAEVHEYDYAKFSQIKTHKVFDGTGALVTTFEGDFDAKGARNKLAIYEGDPKDGKLKIDYNGVAMYRFANNDKGKLLKETRHNATQILDKDGKQDYMLANARDGWAIIENVYDEKSGDVTTTISSKVDDSGNAVFEEAINADGVLLHQVERTFVDNKVSTSVKSIFEQGKATKKMFMDAAGVTQYVALLQYNSDDLLMEAAYFKDDEKTATLNAEGYHKLVKSYNDNQKVASEAYFDAVGAKVKTRMFEYTPEGEFKAVKVYDASGNPVQG